MAKKRLHRAPAPKPVGELCDPRLWQVTEETMQLSWELLGALASTPTQYQVRDVVLAALHRRALVTVASIAKLLREGVIESSMVLSRTLLDIELTVRLVTGADDSQRMAKRLAYYDYRQRHRHGQKQLGDPATRGVLERYYGDKERIRSVARSWKEQSQGPFFDDVREEVERDYAANKSWHGKGNQEQAFAAIGATTDYFQSYSLQSMWVHGQNVESDMLEFRDEKPILRPILTDNPDEVPALLGLALARLYTIMIHVLGCMSADPNLPDREQRTRRAETLRSFKARVLDQGQRINQLHAFSEADGPTEALSGEGDRNGGQGSPPPATSGGRPPPSAS